MDAKEQGLSHNRIILPMMNRYLLFANSDIRGLQLTVLNLKWFFDNKRDKGQLKNKSNQN